MVDADDNRPGPKYVCAFVIVLIFPISFLFPATMILSIAGMTAVYFLWFARATFLLASTLLIALAIIGFLGGIAKGILFAVVMMFPSFTLSYLRRHGYGVAPATAVAMAFPILGVVLNYRLFANLLQYLSFDLKNLPANRLLAPLYSPGESALVADYLAKLADRLIYFAPALAVFLLATMFVGSILVGNFLVRRSGLFAVPIADFSLWKLPEWVMIPLGIAAILVLTNQTALTIIGWNTLLFLYLVCSLYGVSFLEYQMRRWRFPLPVKVVTYLFLFITQLLAAVVLPVVALFDSRFDFRKIRAKQLG